MIRNACGWISLAIKQAFHQHSLPVRQEAEALGFDKPCPKPSCAGCSCLSAGSPPGCGPSLSGCGVTHSSSEEGSGGHVRPFSKGKRIVFGDKTEQRRQEAFNSHSRCRAWRSHKAGSGNVSSPHRLPFSPNAVRRRAMGLQLQMAGQRHRQQCWGRDTSVSGERGGELVNSDPGGQAGREREEPHHFSSRSAPPQAGPWQLGECLSYFHFYDVGFPDFLGWSNVHERVTCFVSLCNLVLRRPKNKNMFCPHLAPGMSLFV